MEGLGSFFFFLLGGGTEEEGGVEDFVDFLGRPGFLLADLLKRPAMIAKRRRAVAAGQLI